MEHGMNNQNVRNGFTLVEILVVCAILVILGGILFAVVGGAQEEGKKTVCGSNLKQIYLALDLYEQDSGGWEQPIPSLLAARPYVSDVQIFRYPDENTIVPDSEGNYPLQIIYINEPFTSPVHLSYAFVGDYIIGSYPGKWRSMTLDSHIGIVACPWHGPLSATMQSPSLKYLQTHTGPIERICFDGHLVRVPRKDGPPSTFDLFFSQG
jgi:prepilin-type N-terminal cleavage/methylation domain-containing protein